MKKTTIQRFAEKVRLPADPDRDGCWEWVGAKDGRGYADFYYNKAVGQAHRYAYETFVGDIPEGLALDHLCRVPLCVNPEHLEPVTWRENLMRGNTWTRRNAEKTHCVQGHEYTPENTYVCPKGWRRCRTCIEKNSAKQAEKRRAVWRGRTVRA